MKLRQLRPLALQADGMRKVEKALQHQKQEREWGKHFLMPLGKPSRTLIVVSRTVNTQRPARNSQKAIGKKHEDRSSSYQEMLVVYRSHNQPVCQHASAERFSGGDDTPG